MIQSCGYSQLIEIFDGSQTEDEEFDQDWILGFDTADGVQSSTTDVTDSIVFQAADTSLEGIYTVMLKFSIPELENVYNYTYYLLDVKV